VITNSELDKIHARRKDNAMAQKFKNGGFLPYYRAKCAREDVELSVYLRHKFLPLVRRQFSQHGLVECRPASRLAYLRKDIKTHRFFLRFDVKLFYSSVSQPTVGDILLKNYRCLSGKIPPKRMRMRVNFWFSSYFPNKLIASVCRLAVSCLPLPGPPFC